MPEQPPHAQHEIDPHLQAALNEEQALLDQAVQAAQAQHLMNRCVQLNAQARRAVSDGSDSEQG